MMTLSHNNTLVNHWISKLNVLPSLKNIQIHILLQQSNSSFQKNNNETEQQQQLSVLENTIHMIMTKSQCQEIQLYIHPSNEKYAKQSEKGEDGESS